MDERSDKTLQTILDVQSSRYRNQDLSIGLKKGEVLFEEFNGYWKSNDLSIVSLKDINLLIQGQQFYGITGRVGSGKSGLLGVILDEIPFYSGGYAKNGTVAYVEQEPIIFSATLRDNILFGRQFNQTRYKESVERSCLLSDFSLFEDGDMTMVGQRGITLSGGQKARLSLARALYFDADIYLLDDPISAVDSKVAK